MRMALITVVVLAIIGIGIWFFRGTLFPSSTQQEELPAATTTPIEQVNRSYSSTTMGISLTYPPGYVPNERYAYDFINNKTISGVSFTIPAAMATGTNLSADSYISVEQLPRAQKCTGDIYIIEDVKRSEVVEPNQTYSFASSTGAAAGNRYEELVYALPDSKPCTAVRYYIHTTEIGNYEPGTVREYDRAALLADLDTVRRSLVLTPQ